MAVVEIVHRQFVMNEMSKCYAYGCYAPLMQWFRDFDSTWEFGKNNKQDGNVLKLASFGFIKIQPNKKRSKDTTTYTKKIQSKKWSAAREGDSTLDQRATKTKKKLKKFAANKEHNEIAQKSSKKHDEKIAQ